jgi:multidrug efflux pump subunit AcrB
MSNSNTEPGHGNSVAAWATVIIVLTAFAIGTLFFWLDIPALVWASAVLAVLGPIVGLVLRKSRNGVGGKHSKSH